MDPPASLSFQVPVLRFQAVQLHILDVAEDTPEVQKCLSEGKASGVSWGGCSAVCPWGGDVLWAMEVFAAPLAKGLLGLLPAWAAPALSWAEVQGRGRS